jgi:Ca2+-binding EF-hand superfamily protein
LTADEIEELREAFNLFDTEATGRIDPRYNTFYSDN